MPQKTKVKCHKKLKLLGSFICFIYFCRKIKMKDDILESVSQRGSGEETAEYLRINEVTDELRRRCQLYEAQLRDGQNNVNL